MKNTLIQLEVAKRETLGKQVKGRRDVGFIPGNVIAKGKPSLAVEISAAELLKALQQAGYTQALELVIGKDKRVVLVKEVSFPPADDTPQHVVFFEVDKDDRVSASVPLVLTGESPGEKKGLMVLQTLHQIEVNASALNIPEQIEVNINGLEEVGEAVRVVDISLPNDIEIDIDSQTPIVKLEMSRSQISEQADDEAAETTGGSEDGEEASGESEEGGESGE